MINKIKTIFLLLAITAMVSSCALTMPINATSNPVGNKVVEVKQRKQNVVVKIIDDSGCHRKIDVSPLAKGPILSRLSTQGEALSAIPTAPEEKGVRLEDSTSKIGGQKAPTFRVGEQVVFTRGPRTNATSSVCRVVKVDQTDGGLSYSLLDGDGKSLVMDWADPEHNLSRIETLANGVESPGFRRIHVKGPAKPETEVLINEDSAQPPCPIPGVDPADEPRPWFDRLSPKELRLKSGGNLIEYIYIYIYIHIWTFGTRLQKPLVAAAD